MECGLRVAGNVFVLYLDADPAALPAGLIERLTRPLRDRTADVVIVRRPYQRGLPGRLSVRPLLCSYFPELARFDPPLPGLLAGRRAVLSRLPFEKGDAVEMGLMLDAAAVGARLAQVELSAELGSRLTDMHTVAAVQEVRTILDRALRYRRLNESQTRAVRGLQQRIRTEPVAPADLAGVLSLAAGQ
jgi:hypothetical protein